MPRFVLQQWTLGVTFSELDKAVDKQSAEIELLISAKIPPSHHPRYRIDGQVKKFLISS